MLHQPRHVEHHYCVCIGDAVTLLLTKNALLYLISYFIFPPKFPWEQVQLNWNFNPLKHRGVNWLDFAIQVYPHF